MLIAAAMLHGCGVATCDEDSKEVAFARALPQDRLARLAADLRALTPEDPAEAAVWAQGAPKLIQFSDLNPVAVRPHGKQIHVRLKGCFDHHVDLVVAIKGQQKVNLWFGEHARSGDEPLWVGLVQQAVEGDGPASGGSAP